VTGVGPKYRCNFWLVFTYITKHNLINLCKTGSAIRYRYLTLIDRVPMQQCQHHSCRIGVVSNISSLNATYLAWHRHEDKRLRLRNSVTLKRSRLPTKSQHFPRTQLHTHACTELSENLIRTRGTEYKLLNVTVTATTLQFVTYFRFCRYRRVFTQRTPWHVICVFISGENVNLSYCISLNQILFNDKDKQVVHIVGYGDKVWHIWLLGLIESSKPLYRNYYTALATVKSVWQNRWHEY